MKLGERSKTITITVCLIIALVALVTLLVIILQQLPGTSNEYEGIKLYNPAKAYEGTDEPIWQLDMLMYDSAVNDGRTQLIEDTWNATTNTSRIITVQINYRNLNVVRAYAPGELTITVDNLGRLYPRSSNGTTFAEATSISADKKENTDKSYEWSYTYNKNNNTYIFTNNNTIEANSNFEGTIQLAYSFEAYYLLNDSHVTLGTKLKDPAIAETISSSNELKFNFTSTEKTATMTKKNSKMASYDGMGTEAANYVWAKIQINVNFNSSTGVRSNVYDGYYLETLPEGCILLNSNQVKQTPIEGNTYKFSPSNIYYVVYPAENYNGQKFKAKTQYYGKIKESYYYAGKAKNISLLAEAEVEFTMEYFDVESDYGHYIGKTYSRGYLEQSYSKLTNPDVGEEIVYNLAFTSRYRDHDLTIQFGDDLLYITDENGNYRKLTDDEYYFKQVYISQYWYNGNDQNINLNKYNIKLFVRHKGTEEYVQYSSFRNGTKTINFAENDIVGWYIEVYNVKETIRVSTGSINTTVHIQTSNNIAETGIIRNYNMLRVLKKDDEGNDILDNIIKLENYSNIAQELNIDKEDIERFGTYANRAECGTNYGTDIVALEPYVYIKSSSQDNEFFYRNYRVEANFAPSNNGTGTDKFNGYRMYTIFPEGVELNTTKEEIINSLITGSGYKNILKQDGTEFTEEEYIAFIKEHTTVNINKNYKNTGKLWVEIMVDYQDAPLNTFGTKNSYLDYFDIPTKVPYESYFTHGKSYTVYSYITLLNDVETDYIASNKYTDKTDVDNDGDVTDYYVGYHSTTTSILPAVSSYQEVNKSVWTENTENQWISDLATVRQGGEYKYKLRVRTGINNITNVIIYDNLEAKGGWKGTFQGLDLSFTQGQGYNPKIYYSTSRTAGTLVEDRASWMDYTEAVDKTTVKSLAFDYGDAVIPSGSITFVIIKMKAPDNVENTELSSNECRTSWKAIDINGQEIENITGINSNMTLLGDPNTKDKLTVYKNWEDNNNALGLRPESVGVTLLQNGVVYQNATISATSNWKYEFEVPVADITGKMYEYTIREEMVSLYSTNVENTNAEIDNRLVRSYTITNTLKEDEVYVDIVGEKFWQDENNKRNVRPENVIVNLFKNGEKIKSTTLNQNNNWRYEFLKQPLWNNREEKNIYSVAEETTPIYYTSNVTESYGNGLKIKFNEQCKTESLNYDYVEIYYNKGGKTYKAGKWGGTNLANLEVTIPSKDFYLYWRTDSSQSSYYGFKIDSIKVANVKENSTATTATLPVGTPEEITGHTYPESLHGDYGNNVKQLWHYRVGENTEGDTEAGSSDFLKIYNITNTFTMPEATITDSITKQGTAKITSKDAPISYKINYTAQITHYEGNAKVTVTDTLPYLLDETKTDMVNGLNGGIYNAETKTITWVENINNIETLTEPYLIAIEKNITVVFKDVDTNKNTVSNTAKGKIELLSTEKTKETEAITYDTATEYTKDITVTKEWNHGTSIYAKPEAAVLQLVNVNKPDVVVQSYEVRADENWTHTFTGIAKYDENGDEIEYTVTEQATDAVKYYKATAEKTAEGVKLVNTYIGPEISANKKCMTEHNGDYAQIGEPVTYTITVINKGLFEKEVVVKDIIPEGTTFVEGSIKINEEIQEYTQEDLTTNGITVNVPAKGEENGQVTVSFRVIVNDDVTDHIGNTATINRNPENTEQPDEKTNEVVIPVVMKETRVIAHHYIYDGDTQKETEIKLADADVIEGLVRDRYTTSPSKKVPANYICKNVQPEKYQGTMTEEEIHVNYYYVLATPKISNKIDKTVIGPTTMTEENQTITYNIKYEAAIADYIGDATVEIVDQLPVKIDIAKSDLNGGEYNEENKTITWINTIKNIDTYTNGEYKVELAKEIKVVYVDQNVVGDLENEVTGKTIVYYPENHPNESKKPQKEENSVDKSTIKQEYKVNVMVEKEWKDNDNSKEHRPESIIVTIKEKMSTEERRLELKADNNWKSELLGLPKYDNTGRKLEYIVEEKEVNPGDLDYYGNKEIVSSEKQTAEATNHIFRVVNTYVEIDGDIIVRHVFKETGEELAPSEKYTGRIGSEYTTQEKKFEKYRLAYTEPEDKVVTIAEGETTVTYYYEKIPSGTIVVKSIDKATGEEIVIIKENEDGTVDEKPSGYEINGYVGDTYNAVPEDIPYYDLVNTPENATGELTKEEDTVIYYYQKKNFNLAIEKQIKSISMNGEIKEIKNNKITKVEIDKRAIAKTQLEVTYVIKVSNVGEINGTAKILESIPEGYKLSTSNVEWAENKTGGLETTVDLKSGETKELEVTLKWINNENNFGSFENVVQIIETDNTAHFADTSDEDDTSTATILTGIKTGLSENIILQITLQLLGVGATLGLLITIIPRSVKE